MKDITEQLGLYFVPVRTLVIYKGMNMESNHYIETYDMDDDFRAINGRPLSLKECGQLSDALATSEGVNNSFLRTKGMLPETVCFINPDRDGYAIWHTQSMDHTLHFTESLGIPSGKCNLPPLIWKAFKDKLYVFAWDGKGRPAENTTLFKAPFFNIHTDGLVCMGTVKKDSKMLRGLEDFMEQWMSYFFNSYFSHLLGGNPVKVNIVNLWKNLSGTGKPFPMEVMVSSNKLLKAILR